jgi:hypothetical protein
MGGDALMGMDVYGHNPTSPEGEYFRASVWSWRPLMDLIEHTKVLSPELMENMHFNDGHGPDAERAMLLAYALEGVVEGMADDFTFLLPQEIDGPIAQIMSAMREGGVEIISPRGPVYSIDVSHVREFIEFCRHSGGFGVH